MVKTASTMMPLGTRAPDFTLPDCRGGTISLKEVAEGKKGTLVAFICNHCPFVKHLRDELSAAAAQYAADGVGVVAVMSNDVVTHPDDSPDLMAKEADEAGYQFPYLYDESQEVAKSYGAACTPDFFLFDADMTLVYRGQFDDSRPGNGKPVTGADLGAAVEKLVAGEPVPEQQTPSIGCNIKWKDGNAPDYFNPAGTA